jgi:hypothetical protein
VEQGSRLWLPVSNLGWETLTVDSLSSSSGLFVLESPLSIGIFESDSLSVAFFPDSPGVVADSITIFSNAPAMPEVRLAAGGTAFEFGSGDTLQWSGDVVLRQDLLIDDISLLLVDPGTNVLAQADTAIGSNYGKESALVELVVQGTLLAVGTSEAPIGFSTFGDDSVGEDEWGGLLMEVEGAYDTAYGFLAALVPVSHLEHVSIENASRGVRIADLVAPSLVEVTFSNSTVADIVLDSTDVALVEVTTIGTGDADYDGSLGDLYIDEAIWDLTGPVSIIATETDGDSTAVADAAFGEDDYIDLIVQGKLITRPGGSAEMVTFTSEAPDDANGDNWAGILIDTPGAGSDINHAEISHAFTGVMLFYPDDVTIQCSHVHNCNGIGVHVYGAGTGGSVIDGNTIERGATMHPEKGDECLVVEQSDDCAVTGNLLELGAIEEGTNPVRTGLRIQNTKTFCETAPTSGRAQVVSGNRILGSDYASPEPATGALINWGCAGTNRTVDIDDNYVDQWSTIGMHFTEGLGIDVSCNNVVNNAIGVKFERASTTSGATVEFHGNNVECADSTDSFRAVEMRRPNQAKFGPSASTTGDNFIRIHDTAILVFEPVFDDSVFNAQENYWYRDGALKTTANSIRARITSGGELFGNDPDVDITGFYTSLGDSCYVATPPDAGCSGVESRTLPAQPGPVIAAAVGAGIERVLPQFVTSLGAIKPNPTTGSARIEFSIGTNSPGRHRVEVFDVRGRRVQTLIDGFPDPGRHEVQWSGRDATGRQAAPGVYFVRMVGPSYTENKKVVLLR